MSLGMSINSSDTKALSGSSLDYQKSLPQPLLIYKFSKTIFYLLLSCAGHRVLLQVAASNDTIHPQATYLLEDNFLIKELSLASKHLTGTSQSFEFLCH